MAKDQGVLLEKIFSHYEGKRKEIIPILQEVQEQFGYLSEEAMMNIAKFCKVPPSNVFGVASFYAQFRFTPQGRKRIMVCRGTACHVSGAPQILEEIERQLGIREGETTPDMEYTLETVACIGACGLAPCMVIDKKVYGNLTPQKVSEIFGKAKEEDSEDV